MNVLPALFPHKSDSCVLYYILYGFHNESEKNHHSNSDFSPTPVIRTICMAYPYHSIDHLKMGLIRSGQTTLTPEDDDA